MTRIPARCPSPAFSTAFLLVALSVAAAPSLRAQSPARPATLGDPEPRLRLGAVFAELRDRNPKAAAARSLAEAAAARVPGAGLWPDPQVQLGFMNYRVPALRPMEPLGMVQVQVMQMVPLGDKGSLSTRVARHQATAERERAVEVARELRMRAAAAFYDLVAAEQGLAIANESRRLVQDVFRISQAMYAVGEGNQADALRAQVEVARMGEEIDRMLAMREGAAARLAALLDRDDGLVTASPILPAFPDSVPAIDSLVRLATRDRPMIRAGEADLAAADAMALKARRELVPDLVVGVQYGQQRGEMGTERMASLMLGASLPVFASRRQHPWRTEAGAMRAMSAADLAWMRAETRGRIGEVVSMLHRARRLAGLYRTTVLPQAEAAVTSAMAAYRVGRVDFMTVLDNRMTVNRYRQELATLVSEEGLAWAELEMLVGRELLDPWSEALPRRGGNDND